jgi:hypothetical protein
MSTLAEIRAALEVQPETLPQPIGAVRRKWWRLGWLSAQAVARIAMDDLPADGVIVTPDSLARALHGMTSGVFCNPWATAEIHRKIHSDDAAAILAALAAEGGPEQPSTAS